MVVFDKYWFAEKQRPILNLVNAKNPFVRMKARDILCLTDIEDNIRISKITPNSYHYQLDDKYYVGDFRTHNKFAKRMRFGFEPLWKLMHTWDIYVANQILKGKLNFGFDSYTFYPDYNGKEGATSCDGVVGLYTLSQTWANTQACNNYNYASNTAGGIIVYTSTTSNQYQHNWKFYNFYDTSILGSGATISNGVLSLYVTYKRNDSGFATTSQSSIVLTNCTSASNTSLTAADSQLTGTTEYARINYSSLPALNNYFDMTLNESGKSNINLTGISKFAHLLGMVFDNSQPTWGSLRATQIGWASADTAGTDKDTKLVITYTPGASTFIPKVIIT